MKRAKLERSLNFISHEFVSLLISQTETYIFFNFSLQLEYMYVHVHSKNIS